MKEAKTKESQLQNLPEFEEITERKRAIQRIKDVTLERISEYKKELEGSVDGRREGCSPTKNNIPALQTKNEDYSSSPNQHDKNRNVSDTDKMLFDKKFKNFLNHKQQFIRQAREKNRLKQQRKNRLNANLHDEYYNEEEVLSNMDSDYQYKNAEDMQLAYEEIITGHKKRGTHLQLFHCELFENIFRENQFLTLVQAKEEQLISKEEFLNYLFDEPFTMMLYTDELAELETSIPEKLNYYEFSMYLLADREPTYFDYSAQNLEQARKLGRGIKCAPIIAKWIDQTGILESLIDIYKDIDLTGNGRVNRDFLAKKLRKQATTKRWTEVEVIEIVNINKTIPLSRLIYQIQFQKRGEEQSENEWTLEQFQQYLSHYQRRVTPEKDKLITKLIMSGKYDSSYIYIISPEALEVIKEVFEKTPKFAEYFVVKEKFLKRFCEDPRYKKIQSMLVRSESNRYVKKESVEETLVRILAEGDTYLDIEEILDFFTNRGRPTFIQHKVYLQNLERQLAIIEQEEREKRQKYGDDYDTTSSDEQFSRSIREKGLARKRNKLKLIHNANLFEHGKKFNVTIPMPFQFNEKDKNKKESIRERKLREMIALKEQQELESMKPFRCKQVPEFVTEPLYDRMLKEQERERKERLERFRLQILSQVKVNQRLMRPKSTSIHCDFSSPPYEFVARPMPWYCQVNLLDRINKQKKERRERILQELINRNSEADVPEGVQRMMERQQVLQQKKLAKIRSASTTTGDLTFIPKIHHRVPNFKLIHEHLNFDLENAKQQKEIVTLAPFSFENRPARARTAHACEKKIDNKIRQSRQQIIKEHEDFDNIPKTQKFEAMVQLRRRQQEQKLKEAEKQKQQEMIRKLRESKFAPTVRRVLKQNDNKIRESRAVITDKIKQFKKEEKKKKIQYENEMIKIYTKVFQRPLLIENGGVGEKATHQISKQSPGKSKADQEAKIHYLEDYRNMKSNHLKMENERRREVQNHHPGQYPPEFYEPEEENEEQQKYEEDEDYHDYVESNLHTS